MPNVVNSFENLSNSEKNIHKELFAATLKRDHEDYINLKSWF